MLDVITIVSDTTPKRWVAECRATVRRAAQLANFPVSSLESPGVPGNIGEAMARSLRLSRAPYVAWVDDDDFVLPNAFSCLERHFGDEPAVIFARELMLLQNGRLVPQFERHHLSVWRRDVLESMPLPTFATHTSQDMRQHVAERSDVVDELSWVYVWRVWRSPGMALRAAKDV